MSSASSHATFSKHFNDQKSAALEEIGKLGEYLAQFYIVHESRSHKTKQLNLLMQPTFQEKLKSVDSICKRAKEMQTDAVLVGMKVDNGAYVAVKEARAAFVQTLGLVLGIWQKSNNEKWPEATRLSTLQSIADKSGEIGTAIKNMRDSIKEFRVALTATMKASLKAIEAKKSAEFSKRVSELSESNAASERSAPAKKAAKRQRDVDEDNLEAEEGSGVDLGEEDSKADEDADVDAEEDSVDNVFIVGDDEEEYEEEEASDPLLDDKEMADDAGDFEDGGETTESSEVVAPVSRQVGSRTLRARSETTRSRIAEQEKIFQQSKRRKTKGRSTADDDDDDDEDETETEEYVPGSEYFDDEAEEEPEEEAPEEDADDEDDQGEEDEEQHDDEQEEEEEQEEEAY